MVTRCNNVLYQLYARLQNKSAFNLMNVSFIREGMSEKRLHAEETVAFEKKLKMQQRFRIRYVPLSDCLLFAYRLTQSSQRAKIKHLSIK